MTLYTKVYWGGVRRNSSKTAAYSAKPNNAAAAARHNAAFVAGAALTLFLAAAALLFTACPNAVQTPEPTPPPHMLTFSVDGANGTLKATVDGNEINSGGKVAHGKSVTFTATPLNAEYSVEKWTITGGSLQAGGTEGSLTATVKITAKTTVSVRFEHSYTEVPFGANGANLASYLNTGSPASDGIYYIKVTGLTAADLKGNPDMGESSPLAKILQAAQTKKVALKFGTLPAVTDMDACFRDCRNLIQAPELPAGVTNMENCFRECQKLIQAPALPATVTNMKECFYNCKSLTQAPQIPESVTNMWDCFNGCENLTQVPAFPANANVTNMISCFKDCESLEQVPALPASVTEIDNCFQNCKKLIQAPEIPEGVVGMAGCFSSCRELTRAPSTIPQGVTTLHSCFFNCAKLAQAPVIPQGVTTMKSCFELCGSLTSVTLKCNYGGKRPFEDAFASCDKLTAGTIKVPSTQLEAYKAGAADMGTEQDRFVAIEP